MLLKITLAMLAFAANSVLCRLALVDQQIDPMSFSMIRVSSGAIVLCLLWLCRTKRMPIEWSLKNAVFLAAYILAFSYAYIEIDTGVGALILFGTVQMSMVLYGVFTGEKLNLKRGFGLGVAFIGMLILLLPGANAPNLLYALIMAIAGLAWAAYSIVGKTMQNPVSSSLANFLIAVPLVVFVSFLLQQPTHVSEKGILLAILSGSLASSAAYVLWYVVVKQVDRITASTVQLSVPCLALLGGSLFVGETLSLRLLLATVIVLFGITLVVFSGAKQSRSAQPYHSYHR